MDTGRKAARDGKSTVLTNNNDEKVQGWKLDENGSILVLVNIMKRYLLHTGGRQSMNRKVTWQMREKMWPSFCRFLFRRFASHLRSWRIWFTRGSYFSCIGAQPASINGGMSWRIYIFEGDCARGLKGWLIRESRQHWTSVILVTYCT